MAKKSDKKHNYIFGNVLGNVLASVNDQVQLESSLMSMAFLLIGMILFTVYLIFFTAYGIWFKILTAFNSLCGFAFMFSYLVTTFQQYRTLMETQDIIGQLGTQEPFELTKPISLPPLSKEESEELLKYERENKEKQDGTE